MESVLRGLAVYLFLLVIFRLVGRRTLSEMAPFDLVVLLIISETTQEAMIGDDHSITNCVLLVTTLLGASILLSWFKQMSPRLERALEGEPIFVVRNGHLCPKGMRWSRISEDEILEAARQNHGLERLDQIKHALIEVGGRISIIPWER